MSQVVSIVTEKESPRHIVPLVLPTQFESEDSDSEDDKTDDGKTLKNEDTKALVYDEDIDGQKSTSFLDFEKNISIDDHKNKDRTEEVCH